jgi:hypothetical protein
MKFPKPTTTILSKVCLSLRLQGKLCILLSSASYSWWYWMNLWMASLSRLIIFTPDVAMKGFPSSLLSLTGWGGKKERAFHHRNVPFLLSAFHVDALEGFRNKGKVENMSMMTRLRESHYNVQLAVKGQYANFLTDSLDKYVCTGSG